MKNIAKAIDVVDSPRHALTLVSDLFAKKGISVVSFVNAHACLMAQQKTEFFQALMKSNLVFRDGIGVKLMMKAYSLPFGFNANGTDLIPRILNQHNEKRVMCVGTAEPYLSKAVENLKSNNINVVCAIDGFQSNQDVFSKINEVQPDIILLGMGMPKQEVFCEEFKASGYEGSAVLICGGAILDFYAERFPRAPKILRSLGMEWCYRLFKEPRRLFKRYVLGIPMFLFAVMLSENENQDL